MPDPVDTDALRTWSAARADDKLLPMIRAAADEVDRLRDELVKAIREVETVDKEARYERDRAECYERDLTEMWKIVENAPHMDYCRMSYLSTYPNARCTCWKADLL